MVAPGWYRDPAAHGDGRYWDGERWTASVTLHNDSGDDETPTTTTTTTEAPTTTPAPEDGQSE